MDFDVATIAGWLIAVIGGVVAWLKTQDIKLLKSALSFLDPDDKQTTTGDNKYLADASWKMGSKQYAEILTGLPIAEQTAILSYVAAREAAGLQRYEIETSRGTYTIENGYIEDRPAAQVVPVAAATPTTIYADGVRIGHLAIKRLEQISGIPATEIDPALNRIVVVGRPDNAGVIHIGVKVGDEDTQIRHLDATTSDALNKDWSLRFLLYRYSQTISGDSVRITIRQGYSRTEDGGGTSVVWTEETIHDLPITR